MVAAEVVQVQGRLGVKGVSRAMCRVLEGHDKGKIVTRNIVGPLRRGDVVILKETAMDSVAKIQSR